VSDFVLRAAVRLISAMTEPLGEEALAADRERGRLISATIVIGTFALCLVRLVGFVQANAVDVLCEDQWGFLEPLFEDRGPWSCFFWQHGPHRQGLGGLIDWCLFNATAWDVRAESWAAVAVLSLATAAAIALAARLRGHLSWSDAAFPLLLLGPIHWETMVFTPNLAHSILPLLFTVLLAYAWGPASPLARVLGVGLFGTLTLFTGYGSCGVPVTIGLALLLLLRPGNGEKPVDRRQLVLILLTLGLAMVVFAHGYHWDRGTPWRTMPNWWDYPRFCALMFTSLLGWRQISAPSAVVGFAILGLVVAAFVSATITIWRRNTDPRARAVLILTGTSLLYAALSAFGRLQITLQAAFMWRYVTLMMPAVCGLALAAEGWAGQRGSGFRIGFAIVWLALASVVWSDFKPEDNAAIMARGKNRWIASYLRTHDLNTAYQEAGFSVFSLAPASPVIAGRLRWLEQRHLSFFRIAPGKQ
jgi:hypothetical protein